MSLSNNYLNIILLNLLKKNIIIKYKKNKQKDKFEDYDHTYKPKSACFLFFFI